jgi:hypothetical protein
MNCQYCNAPLKNDDRICPQCEQPVDIEENAPSINKKDDALHMSSQARQETDATTQNMRGKEKETTDNTVQEKKDSEIPTVPVQKKKVKAGLRPHTRLKPHSSDKDDAQTDIHEETNGKGDAEFSFAHYRSVPMKREESQQPQPEERPKVEELPTVTVQSDDIRQIQQQEKQEKVERYPTVTINTEQIPSTPAEKPLEQSQQSTQNAEQPVVTEIPINRTLHLTDQRIKEAQTKKNEDPIITYVDPTQPVSLETFSADKNKKAKKKNASSTTPASAEPLYQYQGNTYARGSNMNQAGINPTVQKRSRRRKRGCGGCLFALLTLIVLLLIAGGIAWVLVGRSYVHNIVEAKLNTAMTDGVNQIPASISQLPANTTLPIKDTSLNSLIVLSLSPTDPVKNPQTTINSKGVNLTFQATLEGFTFPGSVTFTPTVENGRLVATNTQTGGIFSLVMSPDEMTTLLDNQFNNAQTKTNKTITNIQLKNHEVDITFG